MVAVSHRMILRGCLGLGLLVSIGLSSGCYIVVDDGRSPGGSTAGSGGSAAGSGGSTVGSGGSVTGSGGAAAGSGGSVAGSGGSAVGSGGSVAGSGGAGGSGGLPEQCTLPQDGGPCDGAFPMYWHDPRTGVCTPFIYGGCQGNANRFESLEECQQACQGGTPDMDACAAPGECILVQPRTCGRCDPVSAHDFVAINHTTYKQYQQAIGVMTDVACGPCLDVSEAERTSQYFAAACESGQCTVVDVRESPLTECEEDADCILRDGVGCCEGCDGTGIVAINRSADLLGMVCSDDFGGCPPCAPIIPEDIRAVCSKGRCQREFLVVP